MTPSVWAPHASRVDVVLGDGSRHQLDASPDGWHRGGPDLGAGDRYGFALDGGADVLPDPRSRYQPDGVDDLSAVVEPDAFPWTDGGWRGLALPGAVLYELHVGTFSPEGDFDGAIERLDHLVDLGIDAVEVMPVAEAMGERGWGYDGACLFAVHHAYGGPAAFARFVDACHGHGLGVVLDVVYNHLGPKGNHLGRFGPYFHGEHQTPWGDAVNLDGEDSAEVRRFVLDNARQWFADLHVDGLRLDAVHALVDDSPVHLLAELASETRALAAQLGRPLLLIAEREQNECLPVLPPEAGGWGLDARWSDDLHHALHSAITGERDGYYESFGAFADIATAIQRVHVRPGDAVPDDLSSHHFVTCAQNDDQVGNRAGGERLSHLAGIDAQLAAAALVLCSPGTPLLFQGEEWAASTPFPYFCDVPDDHDLAAAIRDGRRAEFAAFGWEPDAVPDPLAESTFRAAVLDWDERQRPPHDRALAFYRDLLRLRRARPDLVDGDRRTARVVFDDASRIVALHRAATSVLVNLAAVPASVPVPAGAALLLASHDGAVLRDGSLDLPPLAVVVLDVVTPSA